MNKIINILLINFLILALLICLTACSSENGSKELNKNKEDNKSISEDENSIIEMDYQKESEILKKSIEANNNSRLEYARDAINLVCANIEANLFMMNNSNDRIGEIFTKKLLDEELQKLSYKLCTENSTKVEPDSIDDSALGVCYFTEIGYEKNIYKVIFKLSSNKRITAEDISIVE